MARPKPIAWQHEPEAQAVLCQLDPDKLELYEPASAWNGLGVVPHEYRAPADWKQGELLEKLSMVRRAKIDAAFGNAARNIKDDVEFRDYIDFDEQHMTETKAIAQHFAARETVAGAAA